MSGLQLDPSPDISQIHRKTRNTAALQTQQDNRTIQQDVQPLPLNFILSRQTQGLGARTGPAKSLIQPLNCFEKPFPLIHFPAFPTSKEQSNLLIKKLRFLFKCILYKDISGIV